MNDRIRRVLELRRSNATTARPGKRVEPSVAEWDCWDEEGG